MPSPNPTCTTCHGHGTTGGCPDCGGTPPTGHTRAPTPTKSNSTLKWILGVVGVLAVLSLLGWGGWKLLSSYKGSSDDSASAPAPKSTSSTANLDPTKTPPVPNPESCGKNTLWDPELKRCVAKTPEAPPIPSTITVNIPCPSNCPPVVASTTPPSPTTTTTASTSPPPKPPTPFVPVVVDLSKIGDPAVFPGSR